MIKNFFARSASIAALAALAPVAAVYAQETASELRGSIIDLSGAPVAGATVTITHEPTGSTNTMVTSSNGNFFQTGLRPGGPYSIVVAAPGYAGESLGDIRLSPGTSPALRIRIAAEGDDTAMMGVVTVTGSAISQLDLNNGVGSNYTSRDIANQPSLARDVIATLNRDPLAISGGPNNLSVAGVNPRFNAVTIDGARQQDNLGLGSNTFPTSRSPINIDIIESVSLVASDYSVAASGFTGGLVNVTTRGGTNEVDGSAFYYYRDQDYLGTKTFGGEGSFNPGIFEEKEYGVTLRGPIIQDRLFFSLSYDKFETAQQIDVTGGLSNLGIDPQIYTTLNQIVLDTYGFDMGGRPLQTAVPQETERLFARIDWDINNDHRLQVQFQQTEETSVAGAASATNFQTSWNDNPSKLTSYTAQLFSDWTPALSTRLRASYTENERLQNCRGGTGVGEISIQLNASRVVGTPLEGLIGNSTRTFVGGCDRFRHTNTYADERLTLFGQADYVWNDFIFTVGSEYESLDAANGFSQFSQGRFEFTGNTAGQDLLDRIARVNYRNVTSNDVSEYLTQYAYDRVSLFGQARWQVMPELELTGGLRYERISTDSGAENDPSFLTQVGIPNTTSTDGLDLLMPRVGFRWTPLERTTVSGGLGLFSGGDPGVWTLNTAAPLVVIAPQISRATNVNPTQVPQALIDAVANGTAGAIDAIDPNFELPSDWKASLRIDQSFDLNFGGVDLGTDYRASLQVLHTRSKDSFLWQEYAQTDGGLTLGVTPDGRPIYPDLQALGLSNRTVLTNDSGDESTVYTLSLEKAYENGLDFYLSYAHQDVEAITEGSSSRGVSAFRGQVAVDRNNPGPRRSVYQVEDAFKVALGYERAFVGDLATRIDLFGQFTSGGLFTYTFDIDNNNHLFGRTGNNENPFDNSPLYIPNLLGDPKVVFGPSFDIAAFGAYLKENGVEQGKSHEVNSAASTWNQRWDFKIQQDLPGIWGAKQFVGDNRFKLVFDVENFGNLLNSDWGTIHNSPRNGQLAIVRSDLVRASDVSTLGIASAPALTGDAARTACTSESACVYRYNSFRDLTTGSRNNAASVWKARIGIRYEF